MPPLPLVAPTARIMRSRPCLALLVAAALSILSPALGLAEGPSLTIDQARAQRGGAGDGDRPGFPVTIDRPGRYVLTGDLVLEDADVTAIEVKVSDVVVDLAGFEIRGPVECEGSPVRRCSSKGQGDGVRAGPGAERVTVRGGTISGMGSDGVELAGHGSRVESVVTRSNAGAGIRVGIKARIRDSAADRNGAFGIAAGGDSTLKANRAQGNRGFGIGASNASVVDGCVSIANGSHGFYGGAAGRFMNSSSIENGGDGFRAGNATSIEGNTINFNAGWAIKLTRFGRYSGNRMTGNRLGAAEQGMDQGANLCDGRPDCSKATSRVQDQPRIARQ